MEHHLRLISSVATDKVYLVFTPLCYSWFNASINVVDLLSLVPSISCPYACESRHRDHQADNYSKHCEWLSGKDAGLIYYGKYKDEALNQLIDITIRDVDVRARVIEAELNSRKQPVLEILAERDLNADTSDDSTEENNNETSGQQAAIA